MWYLVGLMLSSPSISSHELIQYSVAHCKENEQKNDSGPNKTSKKGFWVQNISQMIQLPEIWFGCVALFVPLQKNLLRGHFNN